RALALVVLRKTRPQAAGVDPDNRVGPGIEIGSPVEDLHAQHRFLQDLRLIEECVLYGESEKPRKLPRSPKGFARQDLFQSGGDRLSLDRSGWLLFVVGFVRCQRRHSQGADYGNELLEITFFALQFYVNFRTLARCEWSIDAEIGGNQMQFNVVNRFAML